MGKCFKIRKFNRRLLSLILAVMLLVTYAPLTVYADDEIVENESVDSSSGDSVSEDNVYDELSDAQDDNVDDEATDEESTGELSDKDGESLSDNEVDDSVSDNDIAEESASENDISEDSLSENNISDESLSENEICEPVGNPITNYFNDYTTDEDGNRIYSGDDCDFVVKVEVDEYFEGSVSFVGASDFGDEGYLYIYTTAPVYITMKDGVESTGQSIRVGYSSHGVHDGAHITLDNVHIDMSEQSAFINASDISYQTTSDFINRFAAFSYVGNDDYYSSTTITLVGDNTLIGPKVADSSSYQAAYGIYAQSGYGIGIKGHGNLTSYVEKENTDVYDNYSIYVKYGALRIECDGYFDLGPVEMDKVYSESTAVITGGTYALGNTSYDAVYGINASRETWGDGIQRLYRVGYTNNKNKYDKYDVSVYMPDDAKAYLSNYIGRETLYAMNEDYGQAYDAVYAAAVSFTGGSEFDADYHMNYGFSMAETGMIHNAVVNDHPEFIWWWSSSWGGGSRGLVVNLSTESTVTGYEFIRRQKAFEENTTRLLREAGITDTMTDYQKAYALYQVLVANVVYNLDAGDQGAYEAMVNGEGVCAGYAKAYVYLLQRAGIKASYVPGQAALPGQWSQGHAWVIAKIDGAYYHSDPTWDDNGSTSNFKYFNVPWSALSSDHWIDDDLGYEFPDAITAKPTLPSNVVKITAMSGGNGTAYPSSLKIPSGSSAKATFVAEEGFVIDTVRVNGVPATPVSEGCGVYTLELSNITTATTVSATFTEADPTDVIPKQVGDFIVYFNDGTEINAEYTSDCFASGNDFYITTDKPITIEMGKDENGDTIASSAMKITPSVAESNITLKNVTVAFDVGDYDSMIYAKGKSVNLKLIGDNYLIDTIPNFTGTTGISTGRPDPGYTFLNQGQLTISGTGTLTMQGLQSGLEFSDLTMTGGSLKFVNCTQPYGYWGAGKVEIKGGKFADVVDASKGIVFKYMDYTNWTGQQNVYVASGYKIVTSGDASYPYQVVSSGSSSGAVNVSSITLNKTSCTLYVGMVDEDIVGDTVSLVATVKPANADNPDLVWSSSNESVATVDIYGNVTAIAPGTADIKASSTDGSNKSATCTVTVKAQQATGIYIMCQGFIISEATVETGCTMGLNVLFSPTDTFNKNVIWTTSDSTVAEVDENGILHTYADGTATITATTTDGSNKKATLTVIARTPATDITITGSVEDDKVTLSAGNTLQLTASVMPENATDKTVTWSSSNTSVAYVSSSGLIKAKGTGTAVITATANGGTGVSASITVTVFAQGFNIDTEGNMTYIKSDNTLAKGWTTIGRRTYYMDTDSGIVQTGWVTLVGNEYYFNPETGALQTGFHWIGDDLYYFNPYAQGDVHAGAMVTGEFTYRGKTYYFDDVSGKAYVEEWRDNTYYYDENGVMVYGLVTIDDSDYYFDEDGQAVKSGFATVNGVTYYFDDAGKKSFGNNGCLNVGGDRFWLDSDGKVRTDWVDTDSSANEKLVYCFESKDDNHSFGQVATGLTVIDGKMYFFSDADNDYYYYGEKMTGMIQAGGNWYMFSSDGIALSGWQTYNGASYYFDPDTKAAARGMTVINKKTYYFESDASGRPALVVNETVEIDGKEYKADANGVIKSVDNTSTWVNDGDKKIFLSKNGTAVSGWVADGALMYYCDPATGEVVTGLRKIGLKVYLFDENGALATSALGSITIGENTYNLPGEVTIDGKTYKVREDGSLVTGWVRDNGWKYIPSPVSAVGCQASAGQSESPVIQNSTTEALGATTLSNDQVASTTLDMANIAPVSYMNALNVGIVLPAHVKTHGLKALVF